jgi:hypothetical protein
MEPNPTHPQYKPDVHPKAAHLPDKVVIYSQFASLHGLIKRACLFPVRLMLLH